MREIPFYHAHIFGGLGGGAAGFNKAEACLGSLTIRSECVGSVDNDPAACRDFEKLVGVKQTCLDLFSRDQYRAFHGHEPNCDWEEVTVDRFRRCFSQAPNVWFMSSPCKGNSGLLPEAKAGTDKYQALNALALRGVMFALEAFPEDPAEFILFENVPRIVQRSAHLLEQIMAAKRAAGYVPRMTQHDCGELGALGQSRKRFLMVSRHAEKVPNFLYEPPRLRLRSVGDVLEHFPLPGDPRGGIMHRIPRLQFQTWVRLAFVKAGHDWRSLNELAVENGVLRDFGLMPEHQWQASVLGVRRWEDTSGTIAGRSTPTNGTYSVADPRAGNFKAGYGVKRMDEPSGTIGGESLPSNGAYAVADPRIDGHHKSVQHGVLRMSDTAGVITGKMFVGGGAHAVADPRPQGTAFNHVYRIVRWGDHSPPAFAKNNNGPWSVGDPRIEEALPAARQQLVCLIRALDGTWHRPFTTLELAALQSLVEPEEFLELDGLSDSAWRERIGNAVPKKTGKAIGSAMGRALLASRTGERFSLSSEPVWVRPIAIALQVAQGDQ